MALKKRGRCCDECDNEKVIPARIRLMLNFKRRHQQ
jgi:hypothetical protein